MRLASRLGPVYIWVPGIIEVCLGVNLLRISLNNDEG